MLVAAVGLTVVAGWFLGLPRLTRIFEYGPTVKTNAGIALLTGGLSNLFLLQGRRSWRLAGKVLATVCLSIGALTLSQHLVGWDLGIDQLLASEIPGALATTRPNRMGPPASTTCMLLGLSILLIDSRRPTAREFGHAAALVSCTLAILPIVGYAFGFTMLWAVAKYTGIALINALALLAFAVAVLLGRPRQGLTGLLCRDDETGALSRDLFASAILFPFAVGWLLALALQAGRIDGAFAISSMTLVLMMGLTAVIWRTGTQLGRTLDARRAAELALADSERTLREADRQKSDFLAMLSHELRNPLAPIRFAVELLEGPPSTAERARTTIARQVQHLVRLIDDLLDLTRITRNRLQVQLRHVELQRVVRDASEAVAHEIAAKGHRLGIELPDTPIWLQADPDRLVQVLVNLINNAARYTPSGGDIAIEARVERGEAVIAVRDNGIGLSAADLPRVFGMFVQLGETRHGGLGIGLALVKGLVELQGGTVEAASDGPGTGSEFRVRLPRVSPPSSVDHDVGQLREASRRLTILVVDDNRDAADMLQRVLTTRGHRVLVAYDGDSALLQAASMRPDVGLLDLGLPGMSGHELAERIRGDREIAGMALVAITGWGQEDDRRRAFAAGFDAHMTKPADPDAILTVIDGALSTGQRRSHSALATPAAPDNRDAHTGAQIM